MFVDLVKQFLGVAPEYCIWIEYVFAGILFIAFVLFIMFFTAFCMKSMFRMK